MSWKPTTSRRRPLQHSERAAARQSMVRRAGAGARIDRLVTTSNHPPRCSRPVRPAPSISSRSMNHRTCTRPERHGHSGEQASRAGFVRISLAVAWSAARKPGFVSAGPASASTSCGIDALDRHARDAAFFWSTIERFHGDEAELRSGEYPTPAAPACRTDDIQGSSPLTRSRGSVFPPATARRGFVEHLSSRRRVSTLLLTCACGSASAGRWAARLVRVANDGVGLGGAGHRLERRRSPQRLVLEPAGPSPRRGEQLVVPAALRRHPRRSDLRPASPLLGRPAGRDREQPRLRPRPGLGREIVDRSLEPPWKAADLACGDLAPNVGITGTPVIDPSTNTAYFTTKTYASGTSGPAASFFHALDLSTLAERPGFPVPIQGSADNNAGVTFNPDAPAPAPRSGDAQRDGVRRLRQPLRHHALQGLGLRGQQHRADRGALVDRGPVQRRRGRLADGRRAAERRPGHLHRLHRQWRGRARFRLPATPLPTSSASRGCGSWSRATGPCTATDFFSPKDAPALNQMDGDFGFGRPDGAARRHGQREPFPTSASARGSRATCTC